MKSKIASLDRFVVITGGPGSGKTTLIEALKRAGFACTTEAGRSVIQDERAKGGTALPWTDPLAFARRMLAHDTRSYQWAKDCKGTVFFDRGIPDVVGYLRLSDVPVPEEMLHAAENFRYHRRVLIAPPWREIYAQDCERKQDFDDARRTYDAMVETYAGLRYELLTLPRASVEERVRFVLQSAG